MPCDIGTAPTAFVGVGWSTVDTLFVRVVTDQGIEGWGEGFGHACCPATRAVVDTQLAPAVLGEDARDIRGLMTRVAQRLHLFGRNGPHVYALSGLGCRALGHCGQRRPTCRSGGSWAARRSAALSAYASLLRYSAPAEVGKACARALDQGYRAIKLHEIDVPQVAAAREAAGPDVDIMLDTNCPWTVDQSIRMARRLQPYKLAWLEEPLWPPEDYRWPRPHPPRGRRAHLLRRERGGSV